MKTRQEIIKERYGVSLLSDDELKVLDDETYFVTLAAEAQEVLNCIPPNPSASDELIARAELIAVREEALAFAQTCRKETA